jgi:hypothetical protein
MSHNPLIWLLHSPARFVAGLIALGLVAAGLLLATAIGTPWATSHGTGEAQRGPVADAVLPAPSATTVEEDPVHGDRTLGPTARRVLDRFFDAYLAPTTPTGLRRLQPLATEELWRGLKVANPHNLPRGPVRKVEVDAASPFSTIFAVELPDVRLLVDVVREPAGIRVASVEPEGQ